MGRSRGNFHPADEDPNQRSRRKKNAASGENSESGAAGQGASEGKKALYHCNYCNKDITGKIRIKCAMCPDFDLCIECFSVGAEVTPHKSNHPYRVMDNLSFPLICPDWHADDEILLLEGIEMYGLGNWTEVAEHVGTKNKEACIEHYRNAYLKSPFFPLPDMSHVVGKNKNDLLAMGRGLGEDKKGLQNLKEDSPFSPSRVKVEDSHKVDSLADRDFGGKKPSSSGNEGSSLVEMSGYNPKRQEFDTEYDNDAEQLLADMEFKDTDTEEERELKLRVLRLYSKRLDERKRRKDFVLERNLLYPNPFEKDLTPEEKTICRKYDWFMRFHTKEEHEELLRTVISEHRTLKRIQELKEARAAGCRNSAEADRYLVHKRRRESEESARRAKGSAQVGPSNQGDLSARPTGPATSSSVNEMDVTGYYGADLLSEPEKRLCCDMRLPPAIYLKMQEQLSLQILGGTVSAKSDAHQLFKMDTIKIDRVFDMLIKKGIGSP
ncbi:transcriptional adapter ADA2b isoform X3 [Gastrolobium bilobum]|uniref:transcriptional adapter ADA2b isoform X3 n=1 Tax=Gastrolobium bilobum TaxID=150636 RepID=UPI002AB19AC5|nr:transcriptional adapter ADA2b isoform X3 [Gastrolobium bilobum]